MTIGQIRDDGAVNATTVAPDARRARLAVSALFLVNGALIANVLPRLPVIKASLGLSNAELARVLGVSESNAGTLLYRTMEKLRKACNATA